MSKVICVPQVIIGRIFHRLRNNLLVKIDNLAKRRCSFVKKRHSICLCRLFSSDSKPVSRYNMSKETSLGAPVAIRVASICTFSSALISICVQLSHTTSAYSKTGLIKRYK